MADRHSRGRVVNGVVLLDKPVGRSSNQALQAVKRLFNARKAGHTGSLDPLASGMLPVCLGEATKVSAFLLDADKVYVTDCVLGQTTATGDAEGEVVERHPVSALALDRVEQVLQGFVGDIEQIPPMYSALHHNGKRLYELARQGIEVEREPRRVSIRYIRLLAIEGEVVQFEMQCSKGTYVRVLVEDLGRELGCGAHVTALRRTGVEPYLDEPMVTMAALESLAASGQLDTILLPLDSALKSWPSVRLNDDMAHYLRHGQAVLVPRAPLRGWVRIYQNDSDFVGIGEIDDDGRVAPRRIMQV